MPLSEKPKKQIVQEPEIAINSIEVVDHKVVEPEKKVEEDVYFTLEDYTELEDNLSKATKPVVKIDKEIENEELNLTLHSTKKLEIDVNNHVVIDHKEVSPLDLTIAELQKRATDRREKMKNFNYKFINKVNKNIDEIEKEPAYKRMGVQLDQTAHSSEVNQSRTTLDIDENDDLKFRSNNSFLHDNVD